MIALFSALEPLRVVNRFKPETFVWRFVSPDGMAADASNGIPVSVSARLSDIGRADLAIVCASYGHEKSLQRSNVNEMRRLAMRGALMGGIDAGAFLLAEAGVLDGYSATCHWETLPAMRESYPRVECVDARYVIDRGRLTSSGGASALDMMLDWLAAIEGRALARQVADTLVHNLDGSNPGRHRLSAEARYGISDERLVAAVKAMEDHIEDVLRTSDLAAAAGLSLRQLERLFNLELGMTPKAFYNRLRLERAERLLAYSRMSVRDVALACGFSSLALFSRQYKGRFGVPPSRHRELSTLH